jgi:hypothetical protein
MNNFLRVSLPTLFCKPDAISFPASFDCDLQPVVHLYCLLPLALAFTLPGSRLQLSENSNETETLQGV